MLLYMELSALGIIFSYIIALSVSISLFFTILLFVHVFVRKDGPAITLCHFLRRCSNKFIIIIIITSSSCCCSRSSSFVVVAAVDLFFLFKLVSGVTVVKTSAKL